MVQQQDITEVNNKGDEDYESMRIPTCDSQMEVDEEMIKQMSDKREFEFSDRVRKELTESKEKVEQNQNSWTTLFTQSTNAVKDLVFTSNTTTTTTTSTTTSNSSE